MSITRRQFLLGTAGASAGLILPSYYQRALEFLDRTGKPLLEAVQRPTLEITAYKGMDWGELPYQLSVGDPTAGPPPMTLAEFANRYDPEWFERWKEEEDEEPDWEAKVDWWNNEYCFDTWLYRDAPEKLAYEALNDVDLGPELIGDDAIGEIRLEHGSTMVSSYWNVEAADEISLSLLQRRLNDLGQGIRIKVA